MLTALLAMFGLVLLAAPLGARLGRGAGALCALVPAGACVWFALQIPHVAAGGTLAAEVPLAPQLGVALALRLDGLSLLMALLVCGIGAAVFVYTGTYAKDDPRRGRLHLLLALFMAAMLGLVLADDTIALVVFWELTSVTSFFLIGHRSEQAEARAAALQALLVTAIGGLLLLAGLVLLGQVGGSMRFSELAAAGPTAAVRAHHLYVPILLLLCAGAFTKSAQVPFHTWLPAAMAAPTPVSAYLHSSAMVKAGVYLLARTAPILSGEVAWSLLLTGFGTATMLLTGWWALRATDQKRILAYSTASTLGLLIALLGLDATAAYLAAAAYLGAHALYKATLFLVAGSVEHETGTRDVTRLGGLSRAMPWTAAAALLGAVSMAGLPPAIGFVGKEQVLTAGSESAPAWLWIAFAATGALAVAAALLVVAPLLPAALLGRSRHQPAPHAHDPGPGMWIAAVVLAAAGIVAGPFAAPLGAAVIVPAAAAMAGEPLDLHLQLWHGLTPELGLSAAGIVLGIAAFAARAWLRRLPPHGPDGQKVFDRAVDLLVRLAQAQTAVLQSRILRHYLASVVAASVALVGTAMVLRRPTLSLVPFGTLYPHEAAAVVVILIAVAAAVRAHSLITAIAAVGAVGFSMTLLFALFSAPDLAMAQFAIEAMVVLLLVIVVHRLPSLAHYSAPATRLRDGAVALASGVLMTLLVLIALDVDEHPRTSEWYVRHAVDRSHAHNIVNAIVVDFRALDTLGEITVLALAGLGVYTLQRLTPGPRHRRARRPARRELGGHAAPGAGTRSAASARGESAASAGPEAGGST